MNLKYAKAWLVVASVLVGLACPGCSDVQSKVAGPGGGPSSGASGSTSRSGGYNSGTNSEYSESVNSGGTADVPR